MSPRDFALWVKSRLTALSSVHGVNMAAHFSKVFLCVLSGANV